MVVFIVLFKKIIRKLTSGSLKCGEYRLNTLPNVGVWSEFVEYASSFSRVCLWYCRRVQDMHVMCAQNGNGGGVIELHVTLRNSSTKCVHCAATFNVYVLDW